MTDKEKEKYIKSFERDLVGKVIIISKNGKKRVLSYEKYLDWVYVKVEKNKYEFCLDYFFPVKNEYFKNKCKYIIYNSDEIIVFYGIVEKRTNNFENIFHDIIILEKIEEINLLYCEKTDNNVKNIERILNGYIVIV